jgi:hypothetical protein
MKGLDLRIETRNQRPKGTGLVATLPPFILPYPSSGFFTQNPVGSRLVVAFDFHPREQGFSFDPMAVLFTVNDRAAVSPTGYVGPGRATGERCLDSRGGDLERSKTGRGFPLLPDGNRTCFVLAFRTTSSSPDVPFRLQLGGLSREGEPVQLPELSFARRSGRSYGGEPRTWIPKSLERP